MNDGTKPLVIAQLEDIQRSHPNARFRGVKQSVFSCRSSLGRIVHVCGLSDEQALLLERRAEDMFVRETRSYFDEHTFNDLSQRGYKLWEFMQHHGMPTRILDWTHSPHIAMWFACDGFKGKSSESCCMDGCVHWFDTSIYEIFMERVWHDLGYQRVDGQIAIDHYARMCPADKWVVTMYSHWSFDRIRAQQGRLTLPGKIGLDHWDWLRRLLPKGSYGTVYMPATQKQECLKWLKRYGLEQPLQGINGITRASMMLSRAHRHPCEKVCEGLAKDLKKTAVSWSSFRRSLE